VGVDPVLFKKIGRPEIQKGFREFFGNVIREKTLEKRGVASSLKRSIWESWSTERMVSTH